MVHNYDINKGIYPGEEGYQEWTGWEKQMSIPGSTSKNPKIIHPLTFHSKNGFNQKSGDQINYYIIMMCFILCTIKM